MLPAGIVEGNAGSHPEKVYPSLTGSAGAVTAVPYACVMLSTALPPLESKETVDMALMNFAETLSLPANQPSKRYPAAASAVTVTCSPASYSPEPDTDPPADGSAVAATS